MPGAGHLAGKDWPARRPSRASLCGTAPAQSLLARKSRSGQTLRDTAPPAPAWPSALGTNPRSSPEAFARATPCPLGSVYVPLREALATHHSELLS